MAGVGVTGAIEEVEDLLIVELCGQEMGLGVRGHGRGPWGSLQPHASSALQAWRLALGGSPATAVLLGLQFWALSPAQGAGSWILGRAHGGSNECPAPGAEDLVGTRGLSPPADRGCDVMGERGQGRVPSGEVGLMES